MTLTDLMKAANKSHQSILQYIASGRLTGHKDRSNLWIFEEKEVERFLKVLKFDRL